MAREAAGVPADAEEAQAAAARAGDHFAFVHASLIAANTLDGPVSREVVDSLRRSRERLTTMGAPHPYVAWLCAAEAEGLAPLGDWRACLQRLRVALGAPPGPTGDVIARLTAAQLACWQGRLTEAYAHLTRAEELFAEQSTFRTYAFDAVRAQLAVAAGDADQALRAALTGARGDIPSTMIERVMPLAARALADQAERLRDQGADAAPATARLDDLRSRHPQVPADFAFGPMYQAQLRAMQALYDAEAHRAHRRPGGAETWRHAADACRHAGIPWDEAYARWRLAQTLLVEGTERDAAVIALRRAHELAADLLAAPLLERIAALARGARVSLTVDVAGEPGTAAAVAGLTPREREILRHVAAGRTYREIARTLVVSEKTVSVHISNMLRKTGTANRVELAQLAHRLTTPPTDA
jgi:DNA-binding CsgD family transcriptional regulator